MSTLAHNPYAPPQADVDLVPPDPVVPEAVLKNIRNAWVAGAISTVLTLALTLLAIAGTSLAGFSAWQFLDVALCAGLTFGIYRKSRAAAVAMLGYFLISKALMASESGKVNGVVMALVFFYYYVQGVRGTYAYHKHLRQAAA